MTPKPKYIVCLGDGMADEPIELLGNKTPLQAAHTPHMDWIAKNGQSGLVHTVPKGLHPGSDVCNMGILGYDPRDYYTGRGPIEAAAMGITPGPGQMIFRLNLVNIQNDVMVDFTAGHISTEEAAEILSDLNINLQGKLRAKFYPGVSYRHILLLDEKFKHLTTSAPHDFTDKPVAQALPKGKLDQDIIGFMMECRTFLSTHPVNQKRIADGKKPATDIWPWSQGLIPNLPSFEDKFGVTGGIITAVDLLKGLARLTGLSAPDVKGATGFVDTDYNAKLTAGLKLLESGQFAYIHIEAPDESGHMGDAKLKTRAIEDFDAQIVGPVLEYQKKHPETRVIVLPDHPTPCRIKTHTNAPVPVAIYYSGIDPDASETYDETNAQTGRFNFDTPWDMMTHFLKET